MRASCRFMSIPVILTTPDFELEDKGVNMCRLLVTLLVSLLLAGCETALPKTVELGPEPPRDKLTIVSYDPPLPATLKLFERFYVTVDYTIESVDEALIFVRPYSFGPPTRGASTHGSPFYKKGNGQMVGWFFSVNPIVVDEISVSMVTDRTNSLCILVEDIQAQWVVPE
jgi:hypothetical protein